MGWELVVHYGVHHGLETCQLSKYSSWVETERLDTCSKPELPAQSPEAHGYCKELRTLTSPTKGQEPQAMRSWALMSGMQVEISDMGEPGDSRSQTWGASGFWSCSVSGDQRGFGQARGRKSATKCNWTPVWLRDHHKVHCGPTHLFNHFFVNTGTEVCYDKIGCFTDDAPWSGVSGRPGKSLPQSPQVVNTRFLLYTNENQGSYQVRVFTVWQSICLAECDPENSSVLRRKICSEICVAEEI